MSITIIIIIVTAIISYVSFSNQTLFEKLMFIPYKVTKENQYYRFFTNTFVHADMQHLIFNMITLFFFGEITERHLMNHYGVQNGAIAYVLLYLISSAAADLPAYFRHKNNNFYKSVGASGSVSAILFASILIRPLMIINFVIPAFVFGPLYLAYSAYMDRQSKGNVAHDAHFAGAIFGMIAIVALVPNTFPDFLAQIYEGVNRFFKK